MNPKKERRWINAVLPFLIPVLVLILWQIASMGGGPKAALTPSPFKVLQTFLKMVESGELLRHTLISTNRAVSGFLVGGAIGLILGLVNGLWSLAERLTDSSVQMVRNIPHLALIPLILIWFGIGEESKLVMVSLGVFFPIYLNTFHGIRSIDPGLIEMGRVYGLKGFALYRNVLFPGALASILVGVRYSLGIMWLTLIVAETVSAKSGIGYMSMNAREYMQMEVIILSILIYALLGKLSDSLAKLAERQFLKWHPNYRKSAAKGDGRLVKKSYPAANSTAS
ncbi:ABC transporter permease subunit [Paenibacillus sp. GCM10012307]|uniref:ABC transporter permease subunit n=1 Tax=Paenibacillus roseus TaxID=2798579 RepID=A0A934J568_9BACL|nr:ABC transporter permease subunit [Paenibacillus roseus]MBJ6360538.1 ABC transporter permease subunit [Paenibacillus roseus]